MAIQKLLIVDETTGKPKEYAPKDSSAGAGDAGKTVALNASGLIDSTMLAASGAQTFTASEALAAGAPINMWDDSGTIKIRNADATTSGKPAHGFVPSAIESAASGVATLWDGKISGLTGLTIGATYFLATTPGAIATTAPTGAGNIVQPVGVASSATELQFSATPNNFIIRA